MNRYEQVSKGVLIVTTGFFAYGALVHVLNMLSLTGFDWTDAPLKWQVLDIVYLILDGLVCIGLVRRQPFAISAFYLAALSQIILYTLLRSWIVDVPDTFAITPDQNTYLTLLVAFHTVALVLVTWALRKSSKRTAGATFLR